MSRTRKIQLTETAEADLAEIWSYLAEEASESIATEFILNVEARLSRISALPFSGAPRPYLASELRVIFQGKYAIYYLPRKDKILIVRVLHGFRDIVSLAEEGGFSI